MFQPSHATPSGPVAVVGQQFCLSYPVALKIQKQLHLFKDIFSVTGIDGSFVFTVVHRPRFSFRRRFILVDASGAPILTLRQKLMSAHGRWEAYRGESTSDLLFSVRKSSVFQMKTRLNVFLASNKREDVCDFKIKGNWLQSSCTIRAGGDSPAVVAQVHQKYSTQSILLGKDTFLVTVYPNVDFAFIAALVVMLHQINEDE